MLFIHFLQEKFASTDVLCIFAPTESATLPVEQRTRAGLLLYMSSLRIYSSFGFTTREYLYYLCTYCLSLSRLSYKPGKGMSCFLVKKFVLDFG